MKYYIKTYGCAMNFADADKLAGRLEGAGYAATDSEKKADLILVVTCVVRQHAEDRAAGYITSLKGLKEKNPNIKIALCGCMVTEPGKDLSKQFPHVDWFIPPNSPEKLVELLQPSPPLSPSPSPSALLGTRGRGGLVMIAHGCDNYCSYCVVPYVRGREYSRPIDEVLAEIKELWNWGTRDIILLGQNVNSYKYGLADLLKAIGSLVPSSQFPVPKISFMTSHPRDMSDKIIEAVAELPYVAKEFHLPLQSGDDEVLKRMNRGYTVEYFKDRVARIRSLIPNARITTDMMAGFPGETEEQFDNSLTLIKELRFNAVNMFAYSLRPQTAAAKLPDQLPEEIKQARLHKLIGTNRALLCYNIGTRGE
jgi:tRNA-2-methylthio-N6-dimethylallyladenosine synthase